MMPLNLITTFFSTSDDLHVSEDFHNLKTIASLVTGESVLKSENLYIINNGDVATAILTGR